MPVDGGAAGSGRPTSFPGRGHRYRLAVVGGGPSGCEAAWAAARSGIDTLLVTTSMDTIYNLLGDDWHLEPPDGTLMAALHADQALGSGRVGDGHVATARVDAGRVDGGRVTTWAFHRAAKEALEHTPGLHVLQSNVSGLRVADGLVDGLTTWEGVDRLADHVVLAAGSFLGARLHIGEVTEAAGKLSEMAYDDLFEDLRRHDFAFREIELHADAGDRSLPYRVRCHVFDESEVRGFRLPRLGNLWAVGLCARGELPFEAAAADGRALGVLLAAELAADPQG